ncbi:ABC-type multidrug transport system, ATPase and permease component [Streptomyces sp. Ncost-T6T-1]|uniref:ATP-binding cassette domain-containing protein n=1 Tax=Streptomyces sp. Ncost-T6T-1 TaxID=1100828 RepID=UPI0008051731|nr:ABC transporter ATP-binding protein [Streptomyces sp. Ncost-T6T-1]SBV04810.1 ABC-type multidrug transport system, ATPase and permease component [Streptomyces sp. Ncost-T6T-1]
MEQDEDPRQAARQPDQDPKAQARAAKTQARAARAALASMLAPVRRRTRLAMALQIVGAAATIVPYIAIAELAKVLLAPGPADPSEVRGAVLIAVLGLSVRALFGGVALAVTHFADVALQASLRRRIVARLGRAPLGWFTANSSAAVRKAAQNDVHDLHYLVAHSAVETTAAVTVPVAGLGYLFWLDWRLALLALATLPLYAGAYAYMMKDFGPQMGRLNAGIAAINKAIVEFVTGIGVVKTFGRAGRAHAGYREAATRFGDHYSGWVRPMLKLEAFSSMAVSAPVVLLVNLAGGIWFVHAGWVSPVDVLTASMVAMVIPSVLVTLGFGAQARREASAAAERIAAVLETPVLPESCRPKVPDGHEVELHDVSFSYDGTVDVLDGVSLRLVPGTVTALVGPSGSGKSTLASLVTRFHDVTGGRITIGGVDVREIATEQLYRHIGFVMVFLDWRLGLAALVCSPLILLAARVSVRLLNRMDEIDDAAGVEASGRVLEFARNQPVLRAFGRTTDGYPPLEAALEEQRAAARKQVWMSVPGMLLGGFAVQMCFSALIGVGASLALDGAVDPVELVALLALVARFAGPLAEVGDFAAVVRMARNDMGRVRAVLDEPPLPEPERSTPVTEPGAVEVDRVRFGYPGRHGEGPGDVVLDDVSFTVAPRTVTALVGASGSGKTTLTRLIARFFDVDAGTVRVGGVDVRDQTTAALMEQLSLVFQDVYLFDDTLVGNIRVGRPDASEADVLEAARLAGVDEIVERLPDGWETRVGEAGTSLSGGERQRVSIARALLKDAPIVLLDEATAALDPENEAYVQRSMEALRERSTLLVIAHRLSTVTAADQIVVLDEGRVTEVGPHQELMVLDGRYARFWNERHRALGWRIAVDAP